MRTRTIDSSHHVKLFGLFDHLLSSVLGEYDHQGRMIIRFFE